MRYRRVLVAFACSVMTFCLLPTIGNCDENSQERSGSCVRFRLAHRRSGEMIGKAYLEVGGKERFVYVVEGDEANRRSNSGIPGSSAKATRTVVGFDGNEYWVVVVPPSSDGEHTNHPDTALLLRFEGEKALSVTLPEPLQRELLTATIEPFFWHVAVIHDCFRRVGVSVMATRDEFVQQAERSEICARIPLTIVEKIWRGRQSRDIVRYMVHAVDTKRPSWEYLVELDRQSVLPIRRISIAMAYRLTSNAFGGGAARYERPFPLVFDVEREKAVEMRASFFQPSTYAGSSPKTIVLSRKAERKPTSKPKRHTGENNSSKSDK